MIALAALAARNAFATESWRRSPPATIRTAFRQAGGASTSSGARATTISFTAGCDANAVTLRSRIERPPTASSCFGCVAPRRRPRPPAAIIAVTNINDLFYAHRAWHAEKAAHRVGFALD